MILLTTSTICQASRRCSIASSSFLYSAASALVSSVITGSATSSTSTHRAAPGPVVPDPMWARRSPRDDGGGATAGNAADLHDRGEHAVGGVAVVEPRRDQQLAGSVARLWAASTAARAASSSSIGTTMPGSTIGSLTNRHRHLQSFSHQTSKVEPDALNLDGADLFPGRRGGIAGTGRRVIACMTYPDSRPPERHRRRDHRRQQRHRRGDGTTARRPRRAPRARRPPHRPPGRAGRRTRAGRRRGARPSPPT